MNEVVASESELMSCGGSGGQMSGSVEVLRGRSRCQICRERERSVCQQEFMVVSGGPAGGARLRWTRAAAEMCKFERYASR